MPSRHIRLVVLALTLSLGSAPLGGKDLGERQGLSFVSLTPRVTAVLQPQPTWIQDSNAAILVGDRHVAVVDAPADPETVRRTIAWIDQEIARPVRYLINTHWHPDHTQGNHLYRDRYGDALTIVGHASLIADVPGRTAVAIREEEARLEEALPKAQSQLERGLSLGGDPLDAGQKQAQQAAIERAERQLEQFRGLTLLPPDLAYHTELTLDLGGLAVTLRHLGGHTAGDTVVHLPQERIVVTGDLLDILPFAGHGDTAEWLANLDALRGLPFDRVVPGHGPIFHGPEQLTKVRAYFDTLLTQVRAAVDQGKSAEEVREAVDLSAAREELAGEDARLQRNFDAFAVDAIDAVYKKLQATHSN